jgi:RHS repeat-associated protein
MRKRLAPVVLLLVALGGGPSLLAEDHNADVGAAGGEGVPSTWDQESINVLGGNVHLTIPLYGVRSGQDFGYSVALEYDSKAWEASNSVDPVIDPTALPSRNLLARSVVGLGWMLHLGRIYSLTFRDGTLTETFWYIQGADGAIHRLFRTGVNSPTCSIALPREGTGVAESDVSRMSPYQVVGSDPCLRNPDAAGCGLDEDPCSCVWEPYWYTYDGSGIRAQFTGGTAPYWTAWMPDGTTYRFTHIVDNDLNTPEQANYKGYYATSIESPVRLADGVTPAHRVTLTYVPPTDTARRYCPQSIADDLGRTVTFDCQATTAGGATVDGGVVRSITVPTPHGGTLTYRLDHSIRTVYDPYTCPAGQAACDSKANILILAGLTAVGVVPVHAFRFDYDTPTVDTASPTGFRTFGELMRVTLPGGGVRSYDYGEYRVWRRYYPITYRRLTAQFVYFPYRGVTVRRVQVDGRTAEWRYERLNDPACTQTTPSECYNHAVTVKVTGPSDPDRSGIRPPLSVYHFNATKASQVEPLPLDGTLASLETFAGDWTGAPLLRKTTFEFAYDPPEIPTFVCGSTLFKKDHNADNTRIAKMTTSYEDDGNTPHALRVIENAGWTKLSKSFGVYREMREYGPDGTTLYRSRVTYSDLDPATPPAGTLAQDWKNAWVLTPIRWLRELDGSGSVLAETDYDFDRYGRMVTERSLYSPGPAPMSTGPNDVLVTNTFDPAGGAPAYGNLIRTERKIAGQAAVITETAEWQAGGYPSRRRFTGPDLTETWYAFDLDRDLNTGLPLRSREIWGGGGVAMLYDPIGRPLSVTPLPGGGQAPVSFVYDPGRITTVVGDPASTGSIQTIALFDGFGRLKEHRYLKFDDQGADQWVGRSYTRSGSGLLESATEPMPAGTQPPIPSTVLERFGTYDATGNVAFDPFERARRVVRPDGSITDLDYTGLVRRMTIHGIQAGSVQAPLRIDGTITQTTDVFGRIRSQVMPDGNGQTLTRTFDYDALDRFKESRVNGAQPRTRDYDGLGRVVSQTEPERGTTWFGSRTGGAVNPDGYNALGEIVRFITSDGAAATPPCHYLKTYDSAGRLRTFEKETEETTPRRTRISERLYDLPDHGTAAGTGRGRLGRTVGFDDAGVAAVRTDYHYKEASGRLSQIQTAFDAWDGVANNLDQAGTGDTPYSVWYTYDALGQVSRINYPTTCGAGLTYCNQYLSIDRLRGLTRQMFSDNSTVLAFDVAYNDALGLKSWTAGNGVVTSLTPDPLVRSRISRVKAATWGITTLWDSGAYVYDGAGNIASIGSDLFVFDALGRIKEAKVGDALGQNAYRQSFSYDIFGNITSRTDSINDDPNAPTTTYNLDPATNRIRGLGAATNWTYTPGGSLGHDDSFDYTYDGAGRLRSVRSAGSDVESYQYDAEGLRAVRKQAGGKEVFSFRDESGRILSQFARPAGTTIPPSWDRDFMYLNGLLIGTKGNGPLPATLWTSSQATSSGITLTWYGIQGVYGYIVYRKGPGQSTYTPLLSGGAVVTTTATTYQDTTATVANGIYVYQVAALDPNGNVGERSVERVIIRDGVAPGPPVGLAATSGTGSISLAWSPPSGSTPDLAGYYIYRKTSGNFQAPLNAIPQTARTYVDTALTAGTTYYYVVKAADTANNVSTASNQVSGVPQSGSGSGGPGPKPKGKSLISAYRDPDMPESLEAAPYRIVGQATGGYFYLHSDHLGSVRLVTDQGGGVVMRHKYLPYGEEFPAQASLNPFRFGEYERDQRTGMDYAEARYYVPGRGRWLTPDPGGDGYTYVANRPTIATDPTGLAQVICTPWDYFPGHLACGFDDFLNLDIREWLEGRGGDGPHFFDLSTGAGSGTPPGATHESAFTERITVTAKAPVLDLYGAEFGYPNGLDFFPESVGEISPRGNERVFGRTPSFWHEGASKVGWAWDGWSRLRHMMALPPEQKWHYLLETLVEFGGAYVGGTIGGLAGGFVGTIISVGDPLGTVIGAIAGDVYGSQVGGELALEGLHAFEGWVSGVKQTLSDAQRAYPTYMMCARGCK